MGQLGGVVSKVNGDTELAHSRALDGLLQRYEKPGLARLVQLVPSQVTPDHLTGAGVLGAALVFAGLLGSHYSPYVLWLALAGLALNWLGDSLDGSLARHRRIERPRYGFYVDHVSDLASQVLIVLGLGLSPFMRLDVALLALVGYMALSVMTYVRLHVSRDLKLSYFGVGPTEVRVLIGSGLLLALAGLAPSLETKFGTLGLFDAVGAIIFVGCMIGGGVSYLVELRRLALVDPAHAPTPREQPMVEVSAESDRIGERHAGR